MSKCNRSARSQMQVLIVLKNGRVRSWFRFLLSHESQQSEQGSAIDRRDHECIDASTIAFLGCLNNIMAESECSRARNQIDRAASEASTGHARTNGTKARRKFDQSIEFGAAYFVVVS